MSCVFRLYLVASMIHLQSCPILCLVNGLFNVVHMFHLSYVVFLWAFWWPMSIISLKCNVLRLLFIICFPCMLLGDARLANLKVVIPRESYVDLCIAHQTHNTNRQIYTHQHSAHTNRSFSCQPLTQTHTHNSHTSICYVSIKGREGREGHAGMLIRNKKVC